MPIDLIPWAINSVELPASAFRRGVTGALMAHDNDPVTPRAGFIRGFNVTMADINATVSAGQGIAVPQAGSNGGYMFALASDTNLALGARDTSLTRYDRLSVHVNDPDLSGTVTGIQVVVTAGTPAASPTAPAVPTGDLNIGYVIVPASGDCTFVDQRVWTAVGNGAIQCTSTTRPSGSFLLPGQMIFESNTGVLSAWNGSAFTPLAPDTRRGSANLTLTANKSVGSATTYTIPFSGVTMAGCSVASDGTLTINQTGLWSMYFQCSFLSLSGSGVYMHARIYRDSTLMRYAQVGANGGARTTAGVGAMLYCTAGQTLHFAAFHSASSSQTLEGQGNVTYADLHWVSP